MSFPRPLIVVSKCLGFDHCRYNGQIINDHFVERLKKFVDFFPVCPEMAIGLGVPRDPVRIVESKGKNQLFQPATGKIITNKLTAFIDEFFKGIKDTEGPARAEGPAGMDGFLLKNRSPTCGLQDVKVYKGFEKNAGIRRGSGLFGGEVSIRFAGKAIEDEGRLKNFTIREHYLKKLFTLARFRQIKNRGAMRDLVEFHTQNKYLLMAYNQSRTKELGRIVANPHEHGRNTREGFSIYGKCLEEILGRIPRFTSEINVLMHMLGGFSKSLSSEEKRYFLNSIEEYRDERVPLSVLVYMIEAWSIGYNNQYLLEQSFIRPYPKELREITDSGKGRNY